MLPVSNTPPRITMVKLGTDLNSDDYYNLDTEFISFYYSLEDKNTTIGTDKWNLDAKIGNEYWKAKKDLVVIPEFVGGSGTIYYKYSKDTTGTSLSEAETGTLTINDALVTSNDAIVNNTTPTTAVTLSASESENKVGAIILKNNANDGPGKISTSVGENGTNVYRFSFWDSTESCTPGVDTQWTILNATFQQDLIDDTPPKGFITPFYWRGKDDCSVIYSNEIAQGHIELEKDLPETFTDNADDKEMDRDPKISGKIKIEGTASDEKMLKTIKLTFDNKSVTATYTPTANPKWSYDTNTSDFTLEIFDDDGPTQEGHSVTWIYTIDSSKASAVAATECIIQIDVNDASTLNDGAGNNNTPGTVSTTTTIPTGYYKVDVVPYIAKVYTSLASLKSNNWSVYNRTANGNYPVYIIKNSTGTNSEKIYIYGFNLGKVGDSDTDIKPYYGTNKITTLAEGATVNSAYPSGSASEADYSAYKVITFDVSNVQNSGEISFTVNGVSTLNNLNKNDAYGSVYDTPPEIGATGNKAIYENYYNRQPNDDNNNLLTDNVVLDIWEIDPMAVKPKGGAISQPVMDINPVGEHNLGFAFVNGTAFFSMAYGRNSKNVTPNSYEYWIGGLDAWGAIGFTYDVNGYSFGLTAGGDINTSKNGVDEFRFTTSRWNGKGQLKTDGYTNLDNQWGLEYIGQREFYSYEDVDEEGNPIVKWAGFTNFDKDRIRSPSISTTASTSDITNTNVYIAYYDSINDEIRFRCGTVNNTRPNSGKLLMGNNLATGDNRKSKAYSLNDTSLIAGQTKDKYVSSNFKEGANGTTVVNDIPVTVSRQVISDEKLLYAGEYVSIVALPGQGSNDDAVVVVWWDSENKELLYSYNKTPNSITSGSYDPPDTHWVKPVTIFPTNVGEYCKVTADAEYGIHIAAYDSLNGDLWYAYIQDFETPSNKKTGIVDSYSFVGSELNIEVAMASEHNPIPYISYYALSCSRPKIAYWNNTESLQTINETKVAGVNTDAFNGKWESSFIPTSSKIPSDHINVGVWKNANGVITWSTTDGDEPGEDNIGEKDLSHIGTTVPTENSYGTVYGNGTKNPVLGYAIKQGALGYIETAQKK